MASCRTSSASWQARRPRCAATRASVRSFAAARSRSPRSSGSRSPSPSNTARLPGIALHSRTARSAGLGLDEVAKAREFDSGDPKQAALLRFLHAALAGHGGPPAHLHEEARELGWDDEELLEAIAFASLEVFTAMINIAGDVPIDGSVEESRTLRAA